MRGPHIFFSFQTSCLAENKGLRNPEFASLALSSILLMFFAYMAFALPAVNYVSPTLQENATTGLNWAYVNATSSESINQSLLEWGNSSGFANVTMENTTGSATNWYINMTGLADGTYNYTVWAMNMTGNWSQSQRRWVTVDTTKPAIFFVPPTDNDGMKIGRTYTYINVTVNDSSQSTTAFIDWGSSLVGWWRFNREAGENDTLIRDWSPYGNNGTIKNTNRGIDNGTSGWTTSGKFGNALALDGNNDYALISDSPSLRAMNHTIEVWIYARSNATTQVFFAKQYGSSFSNTFALLFNGAVMEYYGGSTAYSSGRPMPKNRWLYYAATFNSTTLKHYVDGNNTASQETPGAPSYDSNPWSIGADDDSTEVYSYFFNGTVDEVKLWNRSLSPEEINASYNAGLYRLYRNFTGLSNSGTYSYTAYAQDMAGNVNQTETRTLTVDTTTPSIYIQSPINDTYSTKSIWFNITGNEVLNWAGYSLDGAANVSMSNSSGNWNINNISMTDGVHYVRFYANDSAGNMNISAPAVYFTVSALAGRWTLGNASGGTWTNVRYSWTRKHNDQHIWIDNNITDWIGYWDFEDGLWGARAAYDLNLTKANTGNLTSMNPGLDNCTGNCSGWTASGRLNYGMKFDGANDIVNVSNEANFDFERTDSFTIAYWAKPNTSATGVQVPVSKVNDYAPYRGFDVVHNFAWLGTGICGNGLNNYAGYISFSLINTAWTNISSIESSSATKLNDGKWHFYAFTTNGSGASGMKMYEDGVELAVVQRCTSLSATILNDYPFAIGGKFDANPQWGELYKGSLDEVRIYNRTLNATEIMAEYNQTFRQTGNITSDSKDAESIGFAGNRWKNITYEGATPTGTNVSIWINSSSDGAAWSGYSLLQSAAVSGTIYALNEGDQKRYISWRLVLEGNKTVTPEVYNVTTMTLNDATAPVVSLIVPVSDYNTTSTGIDFTFNVTDNFNASMVCSLYINGTFMAANSSTINATATTFAGVSVSLGTGQNWTVSCSDGINTGTASIRTFNIDTSAPVIAILSPENTTYQKTTIDFNITVSEIAAWAGYSLDGAANVSLTNSTGKWWNTAVVSEGTHTAIYYANDSAGNLNTTSITFTADITKPVILFIPQTPNNNTRLTNNFIYANVTVSDAYTAIASCFLEWKNDTASANITMTMVGSGASVSCYKNMTTVDGNTYNYTVWANDTAGNRNASATQTNRENAKPSISLVSITPSAPNTTALLTCTPSGWSDADSDPASYYYQWFDTGVIISGATSSTYDCANAGCDKGDTFKCRVIPYDSYENGTEVNGTEIIANTAPTVSLTAPVHTSYTRFIFNFTYTVSDNDGLADVYYCELWKNVNSTGWALHSNITNPAATNNATYTVGPQGQVEDIDWYVNCTDNSTAKTQSATRTAYIDNVNPTAQFNNPWADNTTVQSDSNNSFSLDVRAANDHLTNVTLTIKNSTGFTFHTNNSGTITDIVAFNEWYNMTYAIDITTWATGNYTVYVEAWDYANNSFTDANTFRINSRPQIAAFTVSPSVVANSQTVTVTSIGATDPEGDQYYLRCGSNTGLADYCSSSRGSGERTCNFANSWSDTATHTIYCRLDDTYDNSSADVTNTTDADNTPPTPSNTGKNQTTVLSGDTVKFYTQWTDTGSADLAYYVFSWNDTGSWANQTASLAEWSNVTRAITATNGKTVAWRFYANDSVGNTNATQTQIFTVSNTPPNISGVQFNATAFYYGNNINCSANATDIDGDILTITYDIWDGAKTEAAPNYNESNNGPAIKTGNIYTANVTNINGSKGTWTCRFHAYDGSATTDSPTATATMLNTAPTAPTTLTPTSGTYGGANKTISINCSGSTDVNAEDTVSYNIDANYSGGWTGLNTSDPDGLYNWDVSAIPSQTGVDIRCNATDTVNLSSYYNPEGTFEIDNTIPVVTIDKPANNALINYVPYINGTVAEANLAWIKTNSTYYADTDSTSPFNFTNTTAVADGTYTINISANDTVGNLGWANITFIYDATAPIIAILSPLNISYAAPSIDFNITASKILNWSGYSLDGAANVSLTNTTGKWWNTTTVSEGPHTVMFYANDTAGNIDSRAAYFTIDLTKPFIGFVSPTDPDNSYVNRNWTYINTTISDANPNSTALIDFNRSLVGWWRFNREAGENDTLTRDWSSYGNNGTIFNTNPGIDNCTGNCSGWTVSGKFGKALILDGKDDYAIAYDAPSLRAQNFTLEGWVYLFSNASSPSQVFFAKQTGTGWYNSYNVYFNGSELAFYGNINSLETYFGSGVSMPRNTWMHYAVAYNYSALVFFVNGARTASKAQTGAIAYDSNPVSIGADDDGVNAYTYFLNGTIDEVRIWNRALSEEEINASYNAGLYRLYHNFTGLTDGKYSYTAYAQDMAGNVNQTETRNLTIDAVPPYELNSCGDLSIAGGSYVLISNVSSAGTCFTIKAANVILDGQGYTVNYSQIGNGYGINNSGGYDNIVIKNIRIAQGNSSAAGSDNHAIYASGMSGSTIDNVTIASIMDAYAVGIYLLSGSSSNILSNNTITTSDTYGYGIYLLSGSSSNILSNNTITTSADSSHAIHLNSNSNSNTISNNTISTSGPNSYSIRINSNSNSNTISGNIILASASYGIQLDSSTSNNITGGSIVSTNAAAYALTSASTTNKFTNTNFTASRKIQFFDTTSWFNYNNQTNGNIWLKTNVSGIATLTRTLASWTNTSMQWNDTETGLTAGYNITGLVPSTAYAIYNTSAGTKANSYNISTDASGNLQPFTIALNGNTEIAAYALTPINITSNAQTYLMLSQANLTATIDRPKIGMYAPVNGTLDIYIVSYNGTRYEAELNNSGSWITSSLSMADVVYQAIQARWNTASFHNGTYTAYVVFDYNESGTPMHVESSVQFTINATFNATIAHRYPKETRYNWTDYFTNITVVINNTGNTELCGVSGNCEMYVISHANKSSNDHLFTTTTGHATGWTVVNSTSCSASPINVSSSIECTAYRKDFQFNSDAPIWTMDNHTFNFTFLYDSGGMVDNLTFAIEILPVNSNITLNSNVASNVNGRNFSSNADVLFDSQWKQTGGSANYNITGYINLTKDPDPATFRTLSQNATLPVAGTYVSNDISWSTQQLDAGTYYAKYYIHDVLGNLLDFTLLGESSTRTVYTATFYISPTKDARFASLATGKATNYTLSENIAINGSISRRGNIDFTGNLRVNITGPSGTVAAFSCDRAVAINSSANATFECTWNTVNYPAGTYNLSAYVLWDASNVTVNWTLFNISAIKAASVVLTADASSYNMDQNLTSNITVNNTGNANLTGNLTLALIGAENKTAYSETWLDVPVMSNSTRIVSWNITNTLAGGYVLNATYAYNNEGGIQSSASAAQFLTIQANKAAAAMIVSDSPSYAANQNANFTFNLTTRGNVEYSTLNYAVQINNSAGIIASSSWTSVARNTTVQSSALWNTAAWPRGNYLVSITVTGPSSEVWTANTTFSIQEVNATRITGLLVDKMPPLYYSASDTNAAITGGQVVAIGNSNITGNLTVRFVDGGTGAQRASYTCNGINTPYTIASCTGASVSIIGWPVELVVMNVSFAYYNGSSQLVVNQTTFQIGTTDVNVTAAGIGNTPRTDFYKNEEIFMHVRVKNVTGSTVSGIAAGNVTLATINGQEITSTARSGWTEEGGGEYYFSIGDWPSGTYTVAVTVHDPYAGTAGTGSTAFIVSKHWVAVTVASAELNPIASPSKKYVGSDMAGSTVAALISRGSLNNITSAAGSMTVSEWMENNKVYLVFTKGGTQKIEERLPYVQSGAFESYVSPTFGFVLRKDYTAVIGMDYSAKSINILGDMKLSPGTYTFVIRNDGAEGGKTKITVGRK